MTNNRRLLIALTTAALATASLGAAVMPASAVLRTFQVTLASGEQVVVSIDAPASTPAGALALPVDGVVVGVVELTPPPAPVPVPTVPAPVPTVPTTPTTPSEPSGEPSAQPGADGGQSSNGEGSTPGSGSAEPQVADGPGKQSGSGERKQAVVAPGIGGPTTGTGTGMTVEERDEQERRDPRSRYRAPGGAPTLANPGVSLATPGAAPVGVPNFFIDKFRIPPFLLSIYQAAGIEYGIRWEVLAAINEIETDYGRNLNVSSAGALGWMQFMPPTWAAYGTDANGDGKKDPYNPVDAIFAAARYLRAAGAESDLRKAIFAYNHADWYVDSVLMRARLIGGLPSDLVGSLTGLTQGRFPVAAKARYADDLSERDAAQRVAKGQNAAVPVEAVQARRSIDVFADPGSPAIAVQDGKVVRIGRSERLGRFVQLRDAYGNTYTYAHLGSVADRHPVPKAKAVDPDEVSDDLALPPADPKPTKAASAGTQRKQAPSDSARPKRYVAAAPEQLPGVRKERLFASPRRAAAWRSGGREQLRSAVNEPLTTFKPYFVGDFGLDEGDVLLKELRQGSRVVAGTILGRIGEDSDGMAPHLRFSIRPAGRGAPEIDPKPILDGWKLLEATAVYRAKGSNPFFGADARTPTIGQVLLMSKEQLQRRVLANPRVDVYACGRRDIASGRIDRRVLASLEFLAASGLKPTVTSLQCGHGFFTASGNVSHHSSGNAVDIAMVNGIPIMGHQGDGSITDITNRRLLTLQGTMKPAQIISLMDYEGTDNTYAMGDHDDHIHLGFQPMFNGRLGRETEAVLKPGQWIKLIDRIGDIDNPTVRLKPSKDALTVTPGRSSTAHSGD